MRSVKELQDKHVKFELESLDRIYLNLYCPLLNSLGGAATVICRILGHAVPVAGAFKMVRDWFVGELTDYAQSRGLTIHRLANGADKEAAAAKALVEWRQRLAEQRGITEEEVWKTEGVFFICKAQEKVKVLANGTERDEQSGRKWLRLRWSQSMVNQFYCYFWDREWGVGFLKASSYAPFSGRLYLNGHEWLKGRLRAQGIDFEPLDNGLLSCADPAAAREMARRLSAARIQRVARKWMREIPHPLDALRSKCALPWRIGILQLEQALTQVWDKGARGLEFFEQVIRENIDLGRPEKIALIFKRRVTRRTPQKRFVSRVMHYGVIPVFHVLFKSSKLKQYFKEGKALRSEVTINNPRDFGIGKTLTGENLRALRQVGRETIDRLLRVETLSHDPALGSERLQALESPVEIEDGRGAVRRVSALPRSNTKVRALLGALIGCHLINGGFRARDLKSRLAHLLGLDPGPITTGQMTYHLRRLRGHGIIRKIPGTVRYEVTREGLHIALVVSRLERRIYRDAMAAIHDPWDTADPALGREQRKLRKAIDRFDRDITAILESLHLENRAA